MLKILRYAWQKHLKGLNYTTEPNTDLNGKKTPEEQLLQHSWYWQLILARNHDFWVEMGKKCWPSNRCKKNPVEFLPQTHGRVMARNPSPKGLAPVFWFSYLCMNKVLVAVATETTGKANTRIPQNDWVPPPPLKHTACLSWFGVHPVCVKSCQLRTPTTWAQLIWPK